MNGIQERRVLDREKKRHCWWFCGLKRIRRPWGFLVFSFWCIANGVSTLWYVCNRAFLSFMPWHKSRSYFFLNISGHSYPALKYIRDPREKGTPRNQFRGWKQNNFFNHWRVYNYDVSVICIVVIGGEM